MISQPVYGTLLHQPKLTKTGIYDASSQSIILIGKLNKRLYGDWLVEMVLGKEKSYNVGPRVGAKVSQICGQAEGGREALEPCSEAGI